MKKIPSFTVDHLRLLPGVYVSRRDMLKDDALTTFDLRFTQPNEEPVLDTAPIHAIEHLAATYLRNHEGWGEEIIYFGPMGCRTGFYLILKGKLEPEDILELLKDMLEFIIGFTGEIPGASARGCGNYLDMNLPMAKYHARKYLEVLSNITTGRMRYPE